MDMDVTTHGDQLLCIRLAGRLDSPGVDRIEARFTAELLGAGKPAMIDLSGVSFLASMGIRMLISSARSLSSKGAKLVLFGASDMVQSVLDHVAIDQIIPTVASEQQARERLGA